MGVVILVLIISSCLVANSFTANACNWVTTDTRRNRVDKDSKGTFNLCNSIVVSICIAIQCIGKRIATATHISDSTCHIVSCALTGYEAVAAYGHS